jgi:hypothetical protein
MMSTRFVHNNNTHVGFLLIVFSRIKDIQLLFRDKSLCICDVGSSGPLHIIQNEISSKRSKKTKIDIKEVTLQFSMIFQIRLKNNTVNFRVIRPFNLKAHFSLLIEKTN